MKIKKIVIGLISSFFFSVAMAQAALAPLQENLLQLQVSMVALKGKLNDFSGDKGLGGLKQKLDDLNTPKFDLEKIKKNLEVLLKKYKNKLDTEDESLEEDDEAAVKNLFDPLLTDYKKDLWNGLSLDLLKFLKMAYCQCWEGGWEKSDQRSIDLKEAIKFVEAAQKKRADAATKIGSAFKGFKAKKLKKEKEEEEKKAKEAAAKKAKGPKPPVPPKLNDVKKTKEAAAKAAAEKLAAEEKIKAEKEAEKKEQEDAVTKIGAVFKGYQAKKQLENLKAAKVEEKIVALEETYFKGKISRKSAPEDSAITLKTLAKEYEELQGKVEKALAMLKLYTFVEFPGNDIIDYADLNLKIPKEKYLTLVEILKQRRTLLQKVKISDRPEILRYKQILIDLISASQGFLDKALINDLNSIIQDCVQEFLIDLDLIKGTSLTGLNPDIEVPLIVKKLRAIKDMCNSLVNQFQESFLKLEACKIKDIDLSLATRISDQLNKIANLTEKMAKTLQAKYEEIKTKQPLLLISEFNQLVKNADLEDQSVRLGKIIQELENKSEEFKKMTTDPIKKAVIKACADYENTNSCDSFALTAYRKTSVDDAFKILGIDKQPASSDFKAKVNKRTTVLVVTEHPDKTPMTDPIGKGIAEIRTKRINAARDYLYQYYFVGM